MYHIPQTIQLMVLSASTPSARVPCHLRPGLCSLLAEELDPAPFVWVSLLLFKAVKTPATCGLKADVAVTLNARRGGVLQGGRTRRRRLGWAGIGFCRM